MYFDTLEVKSHPNELTPKSWTLCLTKGVLYAGGLSEIRTPDIQIGQSASEA